MATYINLLIHYEGLTAIITINRENKLNALNRETLSELEAALDELESDRKVRGVVITGAGEKAFVAGADIQEFVGMSGVEARGRATEVQNKVMDRIQGFSKPVIAAINGFALGGGLELALSAHIRIAVTTAKLGLPEVSLGLIPGYGGTQRLTQLVGRGRALEMIMTGDMISAAEAFSFGLVNHVVDGAELKAKCISILERTYTRSSQAIANAITTVNTGILDGRAGFDKEAELFGLSFETIDAKEGIQAFLDKRKPNF